MCNAAEKAWDILIVTHDGTKKVKWVQLQWLRTDFELIVMQENKSFDDFYTKLSNIMNACHNLSEIIPQDILVK